MFNKQANQAQDKHEYKGTIREFLFRRWTSNEHGNPGWVGPRGAVLCADRLARWFPATKHAERIIVAVHDEHVKNAVEMQRGECVVFLRRPHSSHPAGEQMHDEAMQLLKDLPKYVVHWLTVEVLK